MRPALLAAAALAALAMPFAPALAAADSLVLQPAAASTGPGGTVEVAVLARLAPDGKAAVPVRAADVVLAVKGGGTVAPASDGAGETKWVYRAPEAVAADVAVVIEAKVRAYPDASGSCTIQVKAPAAPKAAAGDDADGDEVEGAEAAAADAVGKTITLETWRARAGDGEEWNERKIPERGETLHAPGLEHDFRFRVNAPDAASVEVHWWRNDRPKKVRAFTERNRRLDTSRDQDGLLHARFSKVFEKEKSEYTFSVLVRMKDGKVVRENLVVVRAKPPKEEGEGGGDGKRKGGGKGK